MEVIMFEFRIPVLIVVSDPTVALQYVAVRHVSG